MRELKREAQFDNVQPCLDQDDDVNSASDSLSNPQSRCTPREGLTPPKRLISGIQTAKLQVDHTGRVRA